MNERHTDRGFTVVEVLAAISIVMLLVALLLPALEGLRTSSRTAVCASNLRQLGEAYHARAAALRSDGDARPAIDDPYAWPSLLGEYLTDGAVKTWPSDEAAGELFGGEDPSAEGYDKFADAAGYDFYYHQQGSQDFDFILPMSNISYWVSLETWDGQGGNETTAARVASNRWKARHPQRPSQALILDIGYLPTVWKQPYRQDWNTATTDTGRNEHQYSFIPIDGKRIESIGWKHYWFWQHDFRYRGTAIRDWIGKEEGAPKNHKMIHTIPVSAWESASYGMNNRAASLTGEPRVLLVDYPKIVAEVVGEDATDAWGVRMEDVARRHRGRVNVLLSDGGVTLHDPGDIDPGVIQLHNSRWLPLGEEELTP